MAAHYTLAAEDPKQQGKRQVKRGPRGGVLLPPVLGADP